MAKQIQFRRGTEAQNNVFTGALGEITVDTTNKTIRVHDGATGGGTKLALDSAVVHKTGNETIAGVKTFSSSPIVPVPTLVNQPISMGNIIEKTSVGIGYGTGSGGTVTQLTSKSTAVTLNKPSGQITMSNEALAAGQTTTFQFNNSIIDASTVVNINAIAGSAILALYTIKAVGNINGGAYISVQNTGTSSLSEALVINFSLIKGAIA